MKQYISKPKAPITVKAIQVREENRQEIQEALSSDVLKGFFKHNESRIIKGKGDDIINLLGCYLFIHDSYCTAWNNDYIVFLEDGAVTARTQSVFEKEFQVKWNGRSFNRGDYVRYLGSDKYCSINTYVWTHFAHDGLDYYLIQHPEGQPGTNWMAKPPFEHKDGFECVHSSQIRKKLKYIQINCSEDYPGETDELILLKAYDPEDVENNRI